MPMNCKSPAKSVRPLLESPVLTKHYSGVRLRSSAQPTKVDVSEEESSSSGLPPWLPSFATAALGGALFGSDIGTSSSVVRSITEGSTSLGALNSLEIGQIASVSLFGAMFSSASLILIGDKKLGRKSELQIATSLFFIGTLLFHFPLLFMIVMSL